MKDIKPVHMGDSGPKVSNLHKGLLFLVLHQPGISHNNRKSLQLRLAADVRTQTFGSATAELVGIWQFQLKNWPDYMPAQPRWLKDELQNLPMAANTGRGNGDVDTLTAKALNWLLRKFRALDPA
ncbi:hypothetical protein [Bradyrhizobium lablabi]|uniref:hypothetical protein n=1 Tax=Bradyrhizobium lablabi TaxID=722472 RepID=UPI001BA9AD14|nr:hypothetical protein [Bradyrhizobium lablabi]MBR0696846.1 hypothetical protein [Bradyrhizobium lablabi]